MKSLPSFTTTQKLKIKKLIEEKVTATPNEQKRIRQKIRELGFFYSDFSSKKDGYTVADFEALIKSGQIKISDEIATIPHKTTNLTAERNSEEKKHQVSHKSENIQTNLENFRRNRFDPDKDNETIVANSPGNYILVLKKNSELPMTSITPVLSSFDGFQVIYTGIAGRSLRTRDFKQHFTGNNAGRSTLRKSLGVLFGYKQIPRDHDLETGKTKFSIDNERELSAWMRDNLVMYFLMTPNFKALEIELINHFNPPLNLKDNNNRVNLEFRKHLSRLRSSK